MEGTKIQTTGKDWSGGSADGCEQDRRIRIPLSSGAADVLRQLFFDGPTWDGNLVSKQGRDELVQMSLANRGKGWQWLTEAGMRAALDAGVQLEKERRDNQQRARRGRIAMLAEEVLGINRAEPTQGTAESVLGAGQAARWENPRCPADGSILGFAPNGEG